MFDKLEAVEARYEELTKLISDPEVIANQTEWQKLIKEHSSIEEVVLKFREYKKEKQRMDDAKEMMEDKELKELAEADYYEAKENLPHIEDELKALLIPKDPNDDKNIICEIRAGAGGEEAALFAGTLFRMYTMYAERKHWKIEILNENQTELGGYKEISFMVTGKGAYSRFKFESGVHRVQRVPDTESSGRIHTSTATVAVLPVVEDVEIDINPADIKMEVFRSSGAGGQHINKTSSAVRLIHEPSGIVVECQTERSQLQNREYAMKMLRSRLYNIEKEKQDSEIANARKSQHKEDMETIKNNQDILMERERLAGLGQLIGGIAHNLKTPIMSIAGATQGLENLIKEYDESIDDPLVNSQDHHDIAKDMEEWIPKIRAHLEYMSDIITTVKGQAVASLSSDDTEEFTINELIKRVNILMKHELKNAYIYMNVVMKTDENQVIKGNVNSLVQVVNNMISNAIQAYDGKHDQNIQFEISQKENNMIFSITDFAGGLSKEVQDRLFKEMVTTKGKNGTGLGLYMSYSNIKAHFGGDITYKTEEGKGTTFNIVIPIKK